MNATPAGAWSPAVDRMIAQIIASPAHRRASEQVLRHLRETAESAARTQSLFAAADRAWMVYSERKGDTWAPARKLIQAYSNNSGMAQALNTFKAIEQAGGFPRSTVLDAMRMGLQRRANQGQAHQPNTDEGASAPDFWQVFGAVGTALGLGPTIDWFIKSPPEELLKSFTVLMFLISTILIIIATTQDDD